jgi:hypothetical protein
LTIIYNRRHLGISVILISQKYNKVPLELRVGMSAVMTFNKSKKEIDAIFDEWVNLPRKQFDEIVRNVYDKPHNFLYLRVNAPEDDKYHKNFDQIILPKNQET